MDYVCEAPYFLDGGMRANLDRVGALQGFEPTGQRIHFQFCRKAIALGAANFDHWWMDTKKLYGQRGSANPNGQAVIDCYRFSCMHSGAILADSARYSSAFQFAARGT